MKDPVKGKKVAHRRKNSKWQTIHNMDVSEIEANIIEALRTGKMPRLAFDDPRYITDATGDGLALSKIRQEYMDYIETEVEYIARMKRIFFPETKKRKA